MHQMLIWFAFVSIVLTNVPHIYGNIQQEVSHPALSRYLSYQYSNNKMSELYSEFSEISIPIYDSEPSGSYQWSDSTASKIAAEEMAKIDANSANYILKSVS